MKNISRRNIGGFTLVEILVVVLIIGILSAVAIPMYQGAVDKSRFSTLLPAAKSIKDAEEAMRMSTGLYTDKMEDLDISMENGELNFTFDIHNSLADPSLVRTTSPKLENVRLASYFDFNPMMAGQKHCEAKAGDERANRLCGPLLQGQELGTTADGYNRYLLDDDIDKATCDHLGRFFGQKTGKCHKTNGERCVALGMPYNETSGFCGYKGQDNVTVDEGGTCMDAWNKCNHSTFSSATCIANVGCNNSTFNQGSICVSSKVYSDTGCHRSTFDNSICISQNGYGGCSGSTFTNGSICYAQPEVHYAYGCAGATYDETSCCCGGSSCPAKHRCPEERCDPKYVNYEG